MHKFQTIPGFEGCGKCGEGRLHADHSPEANLRQVGGSHYRSEIQHWDYVWVNKLDYFQGQITKYVTRWRSKNGLADLEKARHFLDKYIELESQAAACDPGRAYVDQDREGKGISRDPLPFPFNQRD